jgi:hypothetical protein
MIISERQKGTSTCNLKCDNCGNVWIGNYYKWRKKDKHYCPSCSYKKGWKEKYDSMSCNIPKNLKPYIIERLDGKSIESYIPKIKTLKIIVKCCICGKEYQSNAFDTLNKDRILCNSCVQIEKCKRKEYDYTYRKTEEYRKMMSKALKSSEKYKKSRHLINKAIIAYREKIRGGKKLSDIYSEWKLYRRRVYGLTEQCYRRYKSMINPQKLQRGRNKYHLDHKYSVLEGFKNNIIPYVIANPSNLEMLKEKDNIAKDYRCSITRDELFMGMVQWL